jgi:hypothetical protein
MTLPSGSRWRGYRERLLKTSRHELPDDLVDAFARFCRSSPEIRAGYAARVRRVEENAPEVTKVELALELVRTTQQPGDLDQAARAMMHRFVDAMPEAAGQPGLSFLADAALPVWRRNAVLVFERGA